MSEKKLSPEPDVQAVHERCDSGGDEDGDGLVNCDDRDCKHDVECEDSTPLNSTMTYGIVNQSCQLTLGTECKEESCCKAIAVPGAAFEMERSASGRDACPKGRSCGTAELPEHRVVVDAFLLDKYEVTVARYRSFVKAWDGTPPKVGAGAHPRIVGSGCRWRPRPSVFGSQFGALAAGSRRVQMCVFARYLRQPRSWQSSSSDAIVATNEDVVEICALVAGEWACELHATRSVRAAEESRTRQRGVRQRAAL